MENIVLIVGPPGSGKSSLAAALAHILDVPVLSRDTIKEIMFDEFGWSDAGWSRQLGRSSYRLLHHTTEIVLRGGGTAILESNFSAAGLAALGELLTSTNATAFTVRTRAAVTTLRRRFADRATAERHPGHTDGDRIDEMEEQFRADLSAAVAALPGRDFQADTDAHTPQQLAAEIARAFRSVPGT